MLQGMKDLFFSFFKYAVVGASNTFITLSLIFLLRRFTALGIFAANGAGYAGGMVNGFIWNRRWTFKAHEQGIFRQLLIFPSVWALAYAVQFTAFYVMERHASWHEGHEGLSTLLAMSCFSLVNFSMNNLITFKKAASV